MSASTEVKPQELILEISRTFQAPREMVFAAWTEEQHLLKWWGCNETIFMRADVRKGGSYRVGLRGCDQGEYWVTGEYLEVAPPSRLVMTNRVEGIEINHESVWTVTFTAEGDSTTVHIVQRVVASRAIAGAMQGLGQCLDRLEALLRQQTR